MARTVGETRILDRTARRRLAVRNKPYWRSLSEGAHIGYRRGKLKGSWIARHYAAERGEYVTSVIGEADDQIDADGIAVLTYKQASDLALNWIALEVRRGSRGTDPDITVADAIAAYIAVRTARRSDQAGREVKSDAVYTLGHVLRETKLKEIRLSALGEGDLRAWLRQLGVRKPSSVQRIVNDLKAALNLAAEVHRKALPADLVSTIKYGLKVDAPEVLLAVARDNQILSDDQVRRVVAASIAIDEDFGRLVVLLAATGARFSQIARMTVGDVQVEQSRLMVPQSYKGRKRSLQYIRIPVGADTLAAIQSVTRDRPLSAPLLERWRHRQIAPMTWERVEREPWRTPSEMIRLWRRAIADAGLPAATIPYGLRHSSIVRGLRAGLPIRLVAALHDTSVAMIERHYSRWITDGLDELVARAVVPIVAMAA